MLCVHGIPAVIVGGIGETMKNEKKDAGNLTVSVIIPVYKPDDKFPKLLRMLEKQTCSFERLIIMNTEKQYWKKEWEELVSKMEVHHIRREEFDHGGTRAQAANMCTSDILVYFTQDAVPADEYVIENLIKAFENPLVSCKRKGDHNCPIVGSFRQKTARLQNDIRGNLIIQRQDG